MKCHAYTQQNHEEGKVSKVLMTKSKKTVNSLSRDDESDSMEHTNNDSNSMGIITIEHLGCTLYTNNRRGPR